jgi:hypothetical protein
VLKEEPDPLVGVPLGALHEKGAVPPPLALRVAGELTLTLWVDGSQLKGATRTPTLNVRLHEATWPPNPSALTVQVMGAVTWVRVRENVDWKLPADPSVQLQTEKPSKSPVAVALNVEVPPREIGFGVKFAAQVGDAGGLIDAVRRRFDTPSEEHPSQFSWDADAM